MNMLVSVDGSKTAKKVRGFKLRGFLLANRQRVMAEAQVPALLVK
jgi:hypothetical protein